MPRQIIDVPIVGGVDEGTSEKLVTRLKRAQNVRYTKAGKIAKRYGHTAKPLSFPVSDPDGDIPIGELLATRGDELVMVGNQKLYSWSETLDRWVFVDRMPEYVAELNPIIGESAGLHACTVVAYGTYLVFAWIAGDPNTNSFVWCAVFDTQSWSLSQPPRVAITFAGIRQIRLEVVDTNVIIFASMPSATDILAAVMDMTSPFPPFGFGAATVLRNDTLAGTNNSAFDTFSAGGFVHLVYQNAANKLVVYRYNSLLVQQATVILTDPRTVFYARSINGNVGGAIWVSYIADNAGAFQSYVAVIDWTTFLQTAGPVHCADPFSLDSRWSYQPIYVDPVDNFAICSSESGYGYVTHFGVDAAGTYIANTRASQISEAFPGAFYAKAFGSADRKKAFFVTGNPRGVTIGQRLTSLAPQRVIAGSGVSDVQPTRAETMILRQANLDSYDSYLEHHISNSITLPDGRQAYATIVGGLGGLGSLQLVTLKRSVPTQAVEIGGLLYLTGGVPCVYDGATLAEIAPLPEITQRVAPVVALGGQLQPGSYSWLMVPQRIDALGNTHFGSTSTSTNVVIAAADQKVTFSTNLIQPTLSAVTSDPRGRWIDYAYRTVVNGTVYYREPSVTGLLTSGGDNPQRIPTAPPTFFTWVSTAADVTISTNPLVYTTGGTLDNVQPPSATAICAHQGRIVYAGTPDDTIYFSTLSSPGDVPRFNEVLTIPPFEGGRVVDVWSQDDKLFVAKEQGIYVTYGQFPTVSGNGGTLPEVPQSISQGDGAINPRSSVQLPAGTVYQSASGLYLVARNLQVGLTSHDVEDTLALNPVIHAALLVPDQQQARFFCAQPDQFFGGQALVYDYQYNAWSVYRYPTVPRAACIYRNEMWFCDNGGQTWKEDTTTHLDDGGWVTAAIETGEIHPLGAQAWQRTYKIALLGDHVSEHGLQVRINTDYGKGQLQNVTFTPTTIANWIQGYQYGIDVLEAKNESIRIALNDTPPEEIVDNGAAFTLSSIQIEMLPKSNLQRLPANQRGST